MRKPFLLCWILCLCVLSSCYDREKFTTSSDAELSFSVDTLKFDTIFSTIGSATRHFLIYNRNKEAVRTSVSAQSKYFRLNIDGVATNTLNNLEIRGKDSAYVFVEVTIDPQNSDAPVLVLDSIEFMTNGNVQNVKLQAFGQDVNLYTDSIIGNEHWTCEKPYLIKKSVVVDSANVLNIDAGTKIYFGSNSSLIVKGQLHVNGTAEQPVVFQSDRLEKYYENKPGQWGASYRIDGELSYLGNIHFFEGSSGNTIDYAIIKNGTKGIQINSHVGDELTLKLSNSIIENMAIAGIYAQTANLLVYNTVVANCGYYTAALLQGGNYEFVHTTLANYGSHTSPSVFFNNYYIVDGETFASNFNAHFVNSIICGSLFEELFVNKLNTDTTEFKYQFDNCMLKVSKRFDVNDTTIYHNVITDNQSLPRFVNVADGDYHLDTLSAAKDCGKFLNIIEYQLDLDGNRRDSLPDLGAYERIE